MKKDIKACPFCGGEAAIVQPQSVACTKCWASLSGASVDAAIALWNQRAAVTDQQFNHAVHDGRLWRVVEECEMVPGEPEDTMPLNEGEICYRCSLCDEPHYCAPSDDRFNYCVNCGAFVVNIKERGE